MPTDETTPSPDAAKRQDGDKHPLSPAAERALAEAAARRAAGEGPAAAPSNEIGGRGGLDPIRYGDWEINGLTSDF